MADLIKNRVIAESDPADELLRAAEKAVNELEADWFGVTINDVTNRRIKCYWRTVTRRHRKLPGAEREIMSNDKTASSISIAELMLIIERDNARWWRDLNTGRPIDRNVGELLCLMH